MKAQFLRRVNVGLPFGLVVGAVVAWGLSLDDAVLPLLVTGIALQLFAAVWGKDAQPPQRHRAVWLTMSTAMLIALCAGPRASLVLLPAGIACLFVLLGTLANVVVRTRASVLRRRLPDDFANTLGDSVDIRRGEPRDVDAA